jgi:hypothetical protein
MNDSILRDKIFSTLEDYNVALSLFESIYNDSNLGLDSESIGYKYEEQWFIVQGGANLPWDNNYISTLFEQIKEYHILNQKSKISEFFWADFNHIQNKLWALSPKIAKIVTENGWHNGMQTKIFRDSTYDPKSPYFGSFPIPEQYLPKIKSTELVEV